MRKYVCIHKLKRARDVQKATRVSKNNGLGFRVKFKKNSILKNEDAKGLNIPRVF